MFCEECGAELEPGVRFCENCGTPVPEENQTQVSNSHDSDGFSFCDFSDSNWASNYKSYSQKGSGEKGIIVTRLNALCDQLSCSKDSLLEIIKSYSAYCALHGVDYSFLDMENQRVVSASSGSVENVTDAIKKIQAVFKAKYLFILGNENIIRVSEWKNESYDSDQTVTSDLSYQTLNLVSPWDGHNYVFADVIRVGRLPSYHGESIEQFTSYFKNVMNAKGSFSNLTTYGLSAKVWKNESDYEYKSLGSSPTDSAPTVTINTVDNRISPQTNILFFNLHGSENTKFWYGQEGDVYPEAFEPKNINTINNPFFLGVEACYGAKFTGNQSEEDSIVIKAMQNGCVAFLGSSKIAYGTSNPPGCCADLVIGEFLKQIMKGKSAGDAHVLGLKRLVEETENFDDAEIKTFAEFGLFGDPAQSINFGSEKNNKSADNSKSFFGKNIDTVSQRLHVNIPDIRTAIKMRLVQVDEKINTLINEYTYQKYAAVRGIKPATYKIEGRDMYQSIYQNPDSKICKTVKIYYDKNGKIKKELESK